MKAARTYILMFVPIPGHWWRGFGTGGSAGILPAVSGMLPDNTALRGADRNPLSMHAAQEIAGNMPTLLDHLFWTWFVDNPRRNLQ